MNERCAGERGRPGRSRRGAVFLTWEIIAAGHMAGMTSIPRYLPIRVYSPHEKDRHALRTPWSGCRCVRTDRSVWYGQPDIGRDIRASGIRDRAGDEFLRPFDSDD